MAFDYRLKMGAALGVYTIASFVFAGRLRLAHVDECTREG